MKKVEIKERDREKNVQKIKKEKRIKTPWTTFFYINIIILTTESKERKKMEIKERNKKKK